MKLRDNRLWIVSAKFHIYGRPDVIPNEKEHRYRVIVIEDVRRLLHNTPCSNGSRAPERNEIDDKQVLLPKGDGYSRGGYYRGGVSSESVGDVQTPNGGFLRSGFSGAPGNVDASNGYGGDEKFGAKYFAAPKGGSSPRGGGNENFAGGSSNAPGRGSSRGGVGRGRDGGPQRGVPRDKSRGFNEGFGF
jgi:hypothetical protein